MVEIIATGLAVWSVLIALAAVAGFAVFGIGWMTSPGAHSYYSEAVVVNQHPTHSWQARVRYTPRHGLVVRS